MASYDTVLSAVLVMSDTARTARSVSGGVGSMSFLDTKLYDNLRHCLECIAGVGLDSLASTGSAMDSWVTARSIATILSEKRCLASEENVNRMFTGIYLLAGVELHRLLENGEALEENTVLVLKGLSDMESVFKIFPRLWPRGATLSAIAGTLDLALKELLSELENP